MASGAGSSRAIVLPALMILTGVFFLLAAPGGVTVAAAEVAAPPPGPGLEFRVGGPRGWRVPDANTSYDWWAKNNRFHVGDHLYFKYANDSVLLVDRRAVDACNASEPLAAFADGATRFRLDRPGFFCFISGEADHCQRGQRLIVRVMVHPAQAAAPVPATSAPGAPARPSGCWCPDSSGVGAGIVAAGGVAFAAAVATVVGVVLMLQ